LIAIVGEQHRSGVTASYWYGELEEVRTQP
jgi:hypothetical protein